MAPHLDGRNHRLLQVLRRLYCERNPDECARVRLAPRDRDVPPDLMPNGVSRSELFEPGI